MTKTPTDPIRFIHTADWHIRDTQYGRAFRGDDVTRSVWEVVDRAIAEKVDFIINGGDTFQIARPSGPMMDLLFSVHAKLKAAGIPMFIVTGNHDMAQPSFLSLPDYAGTAPDEQLAGVICLDNRTVSYKGVRLAGFPGLPWQEVAPAIAAMEPVDILCWHGAVNEFVPFEMDNAWSMADMPRGKAKAWLLGDIHLPGRQRMEDGTLVAYPGPIELQERGEPAVKKIDFYTLADGWRDAPFPEPFEYELDTRKVVFLTIGDEQQADQAIGVVRQAVLDNPARPPMVFLSYTREMKFAVTRIRELLDLRSTIFRAANVKAVLKLAVRRGEAGAAMPLLDAVVGQVVPAGTPNHEIAIAISRPGVDVRQLLGMWVEQQLTMEGLPGAPEPAAEPKPAPALIQAETEELF